MYNKAHQFQGQKVKGWPAIKPLWSWVIARILHVSGGIPCRPHPRQPHNLFALPCLAFNRPRYEVWLHALHGSRSSSIVDGPPLLSILPPMPAPSMISCYPAMLSMAFLVLLFLTISFTKQSLDFLIIWPKKLSFLDIMDSIRLVSAFSITHLLIPYYVSMILSKSVWESSFQKLEHAFDLPFLGL